MIYEVIGLPGAGKSYIAERISKKNNIRLISRGSRVRKYQYLLLFALKHPRIFCFLMKHLVKENWKAPKMLMYIFKILLADSLAKHYLAEREGGDCVVDQGLMFSVLFIYERDVPTSVTKKFVSFFSSENIKFIIVEASDDVRQKRMIDRGRVPRLKMFGQGYVDKWMPIFMQNHIKFKKQIIKKLNHTVVKN